MLEGKKSLSGLVELGLLAVILVYPVASIFQGVDFSDMGYLLSKYTFAFEPDGLTFSFGWGLTEFLGGLVWLAGGAHLYLIFKLAFAAVTLTTVYLVWRIMQEYLPRSILLAGLAFTMLVTGADMQWLNYYNLTALFFVAAILSLHRAAQKDSGRWYFLAALWLGCATLARIPNALALPALLYPFFVNRKRGTWLPHLGLAVAGGLAAAGVMLILLVASGQTNNYIDQIGQLFSALTNSKSHSLSSLLPRQAYDLFKVLAMFLVLAFPLLFVRRIRHTWLARGLLTLPHLLLAITYFALRLYNHMNVEFFPVYYGLALTILAFVTGWRHVSDRGLRGLTLLAVFITFVTFQGSNRMLPSAMYGFWVLMPLTFYFLQAFLRSVPTLSETRRTICLLLSPAFLIALFFCGTYMFRESGNRTRMLSSVSEPKLAGLLTSTARARVVDELLTVVRPLAKRYNSLLQCNDLPLLHYLLELPPYAGILWYQCEIEADLRTRLSDQNWLSNHGYPLVIRHTAPSEDSSWPERDDDGGRAVRRQKKDAARRNLLLAFTQKHAYRIVWSNGYFEVLVPPKAPLSSD